MEVRGERIFLYVLCFRESYTGKNHTQGHDKSPNPLCHFAFTYFKWTYIKINQKFSEWLCKEFDRVSLYRKKKDKTGKNIFKKTLLVSEN